MPCAVWQSRSGSADAGAATRRAGHRLAPRRRGRRHPWRHGLATFLAFVVAGALPLAPFIAPTDPADRFAGSLLMTLAALFGVGAARGAVTAERWWRTGSEMLGLGIPVAGAAYGAGALAASAM
ncbi:MAG: VIT1/CCC1 transporter family protein [Acidobacteriota bacterium]